MSLQTRLVVIDRRNMLVFGMEWMIPPMLRPLSKERSALASDHKASHALVLPQGSNKERPMLGFAYGLPRRVRGYSAAVLLGLFVPVGAAALVQSMGQGRVGVVVTNDGRPVVEADGVMSLDSARVLLDSMCQMLGQPISVFGDVAIIEGVTEIALGDLLKLPHATKLAKLLPAKKPIALIVGSVVVLALAVAGYQALLIWKERQAQEERERILKQQPVDPNVLYRKNLPANLLTAGTRVEALPLLKATYGKVPDYYRGWRLDTLTCQPGTCSTTWKIDAGTYEDFTNHPFAGANNIQYSPDFKSISFSLPADQAVKSQGVTEESLLDTRTFLLKVGSIVQKLSRKDITLKIDEAKVYGLPPGAAEAAIRNPIKVGTWTYASSLANQQLPTSFPPGFTIDSVEIMLTTELDKATVKIQGKYYVKS